MNAGNTFISDGDLGQIGVLEVAIVRLLLLDTESLSAASGRIESAGLDLRDLTSREHLNMPPVLVLHSKFSCF